MAQLKKGDFIELDYTGKLDDGTVFDTTIQGVAEAAGLRSNGALKPIIICLGEGHLLKGIDDFLEGKTIGAHTIALPAAQAFGKKDAKLLKLIPQAKFKEAKIQPHVGLEVNIDDQYGVVRSLSGGRVTVDFNHPLAGRDLTYDVDVKRLIERTEEKAAAILEMIGFHHHGVTMEGEGHLVIMTHQQPPAPVADALNGMITRLTGVTTVSYHAEAPPHA